MGKKFFSKSEKLKLTILIATVGILIIMAMTGMFG
jgi:hypothetical protein